MPKFTHSTQLTISRPGPRAPRTARGEFSARGQEVLSQLALPETEHASEWRILSADHITDYFIDFSHNDGAALREYAEKVKGTGVYFNHSHDVRHWLGVVAESWWDDEGGGIPGINGIYRLSRAKAEEEGRLIEGIDMGAVNRTSLGIVFEFVPSHDFEDERDFWMHLGEEINGETVRMLVTKVLETPETSIVQAGSDRGARRVPGDAFEGSGDEGHKTLSRPPLGPPRIPAGTSKQEPQAASFGAPEINPEGTKTMNKKAMEKLAASLGVSAEALAELSAEDLGAKLEAFGEARAKSAESATLTRLRGDLDEEKAAKAALAADLEEANDKINKLRPEAEMGRQALDKARESAVAAFTRANGTGEDLEPLRENIRRMDFATANATAALYEKQAKAALGGGRSSQPDPETNPSAEGARGSEAAIEDRELEKGARVLGGK
ncbi:MAG: hypothetical protein RLY93_20565 [Sumerlaeia bacterium]